MGIDCLVSSVLNLLSTSSFLFIFLTNIPIASKYLETSPSLEKASPTSCLLRKSRPELSLFMLIKTSSISSDVV